MTAPSTIQLGLTTDHRPLTINVPALLEGGGLITASSGLGKSWLLRVIIEQVIAHCQVIVIDPEGEFASLREKFPMLLVGQGGEVAAEIRSAKLLARKLVELNLSAVIDLYDVGDWDARRAYLAEFLPGLINIPKALYHPILIPIDEAQRFAPKAEGGTRSGDPALLSRKQLNLLSTTGRKRGLRPLLATQRLSAIHNDSIADMRTRFIGGTTLDNDLKRAGDELGLAGAERLVLRSLKPGEFFAYGPALKSTGVVRFHSGPVITTHPKLGAKRLYAPPPTPDAIKQLAEALSDLPAEAQAERDELATLQQELRDARNQVRTLELQKRNAPAAPPTRVEVPVEVTVEVPVFRNGELALLNAARTDLAKATSVFEAINSQLATAAVKIVQARTPKPPASANRPIDNLRSSQLVSRNEARTLAMDRDAARPPAERRPPTSEPPPADGAYPNPKLDKAQRAILTVLVQRGPRTKRQLAVQTGYAIKGGGFKNAIGALNTGQLIERDGEQIAITKDGERALGAWTALPSGWKLYELWLSHVDKAERGILMALREVYPDPYPLTELAERAGQLVDRPGGYKAGAGGFKNAIGKLRTLQLVVNSGRKQVRLSQDLVD